MCSILLLPLVARCLEDNRCMLLCGVGLELHHCLYPGVS